MNILRIWPIAGQIYIFLFVRIHQTQTFSEAKALLLAKIS